jgi:hypothetical protein
MFNFKRGAVFPFLIIFVSVSLVAARAAADQIVLKTAQFQYAIDPEGKNLSFTDLATGKEYLRTNEVSRCASVRVGGQESRVASASLAEGALKLKFENGTAVVLLVSNLDSCLALKVESLSGPAVDALTFLHIPLTLQGKPDEPFGACALSLNLITRVDALPALQRDLTASCEKPFGLAGAKVAIVAAPVARMLEQLQQTLLQGSELPVCKVAGPWAAQTAFTHGSYLFNFGTLTETNVQDWINMTKTVGFTQIDSHGGGAFFKFGDMELNRQKWPDGWDSWKRIASRLHGAGIGAIFHTYAFFIDKGAKYVTPVPDPRLDAFRSFTLTQPIDAESTELPVNESTAGMSTITGFFEHNSVVLHIGDELVTFGGFSREPPWKFTSVKRGALGTKAALHEQGAKARHLKECFGLFVPNVESSLFEEIAANHADVVNQCGFDGIYLDAIDGSGILRGGDASWYWATKFVVEIQKRLKEPVGMEMSAMWHHFWQYRTRWQAWDYPRRGHKRFLDIHAEGVNGGLMLPLHLGWWNFDAFNSPQIEPTYPDVIEYLGAKLIGWDAGISLTAGLDQKALEQTPLFRRAAETLRTCEDLRHSGAYDAAARAKLREPGKEFELVKKTDAKPRFRRLQTQARTISGSDPRSTSLAVTNPFASQPLRFRLEALISVDPMTGTNATVLGDVSAASESWTRSSAQGVTFSVAPATNGNNLTSEIAATNSGGTPRNAAWVRFQKKFDPPLNIKKQQGLALEIEGDGSGALVAVRLESPQHVAYGAVADRYVDLDYTGLRSFELVETESARWSDFSWDDKKGLYHLYREEINFGMVDSLTFWLQNLAPGQPTRCRVGQIRAVPLVQGTMKNPRVLIAGQTLEFPVELTSGCWIECNGPEDCAVYGSKGEPKGKITPRGTWLSLPGGVTRLEFGTGAGAAAAVRARLTVFMQGEEI